MTIDPASGFVQWTPAASGAYDVTVTASDGASSTPQHFVLIVGAGPIPVTGASMTAQPTAASQGETVTFTLALVGDGQALTVTDPLPAQLAHQSSSTNCPGDAPAYASASHTVTYSGTPGEGQSCALTIVTRVNTAARLTVTNTATVDDGTPETVQVSVALNPARTFLPVVRK
jgi:uncharacterized repeat protein (TIGR01451 family)